MLHVGWHPAVDRDALSRSRVNKLKMDGVKSYTSDQLLICFGPVILPVADERMTDSRELCSDLVLQSSDQIDADE